MPTEYDEWRGREIRGEVHDESSFVLNKKFILGIAGLFSTAPDLVVFLKMLLDDGKENGREFFSSDTVRQMHTDQLEGSSSRAGLGWEMGQPLWMGDFAKEPFGKTGFTGCSVLCDPDRGLGLILLSNTTYPKRKAGREEINKVRRALADTVFGQG